VGVRFLIGDIEMYSGILLMLCIPQFEKPWNKGKAKVFQQEVFVTILFMDNKTLYFLKINTAVIQQQSFTLSSNKTTVIQNPFNVVS
jgi:hypothetical protein